MCLSNRTHQNIYHNHTNTGLMWIQEKWKTFLNKYHKIMDFILQKLLYKYNSYLGKIQLIKDIIILNPYIIQVLC